MIVDSSAVIAILRDEPDGDDFLDAIETSPLRAMSIANWFETTMVLTGTGRPLLLDIFDETIAQLRIEIVPVDLAQGRLAREAFRRFGKGTGHPAKLNFGDCFAYALAKATGRPLLFKGRDFARTDILSALGGAGAPRR